jgi:hypothetical protein
LIDWAEAAAGIAAAARAVTAVIDRMIFFIGSVPRERCAAPFERRWTQENTLSLKRF